MPSSQHSKALRLATKAHAGQKRTSGEPFLTHLTAVADLLKEIGADEETLTAALLHDTLEDTAVTQKQLKKEFGSAVTGLVEGVTKVEALEKTFDKQTRNMESVRKMFRAMGKDIRVLFIKLADRLHNMRTLSFVPVEKQVRIARETLDVYCPLAQLLGIRAWYEELADHCFTVLDPVEAELMRRKFTQTWKRQHRSLEAWIGDMKLFLKRGKVRTVFLDLKRRSLRDVRNVSVEHEYMLQEIESFHTIHITLPDSADCYGMLGVIHSFAAPLPGGIDDYVASPKVNGYQALHTAVLAPSGNPMTVIIQTETMRKEAELGMALFYELPSHQWRKSVPDWMEALLTLDESERDLQSFFHRVQTEIFTERSRVQLVFRRSKKAVDLPAYASVLDLAYYAGKDLGSSAVSAVVNGKPTGIKQLVHDGDVVELDIGRKGVPRGAEDLYYIHTALAHKHLVTHLSTLPRRERIARGRALLQKAINFTMDPFFSIRWQKDVASRIEASDDVLQNIGSGIIDPFLYVEERGRPEEFFLLDSGCFQFPSGTRPGSTMRYMLRASLEEFRSGAIVGVQAGPDVIDVVASSKVKRARWNVFSREIVPLKIREEYVDFPFYFALRWSFLPETNPLKDIAVIESFLDTPVHLLQFASTSVTLSFRTDQLRELQIAYKHLSSLTHIIDLFRITPG